MKRGAGTWKPAAGAGSSTLTANDRTRLVGKLLVSLARVCALEYACTYLVPYEAGENRFHQMSEPLEGRSIHPTLPYLASS
jgi:hypothetical protein